MLFRSYAVFNLGGRYQLHKRMELFAQLNNVFDRRYYTAAQLGPTGFNDQGTFVARPLPANSDGSFSVRQATFFAPGAPRIVWGGVKIHF